MARTIRVAFRDATVKQLIKHILNTLTRMEANMADLSESVTDLKGAIDGVAQRLLPKIAALELALTAAIADDDTAAETLAEATQAAADIRTEVDRLNALGADPTTPVEEDPTEPVEPPEVTVESESESESESAVDDSGGEDV